jgi:hypothetical protein
MLQPMHFVNERATPYLTVTDFFNIFNDEMHSLYLLAFLLTADHDKAEECLVSAMGECVEGVGVFTDWVRSWTRGAVLKRAIRMTPPPILRRVEVPREWQAARPTGPRDGSAQPNLPGQPALTWLEAKNLKMLSGPHDLVHGPPG